MVVGVLVTSFGINWMSDQLDEKIASRQFKASVIAPLAMLVTLIFVFWSFWFVASFFFLPAGVFGFLCIATLWRTWYLMPKKNVAKDDAVQRGFSMVRIPGLIVLVFGLAFLCSMLVPFSVDYASQAQKIFVLHFPAACICFGILALAIDFWEPKPWPTYSPARVMQGFSFGRIILYQVC